LSVYIIGSICSNSYSEDSDIDIDFCASSTTEDDNDAEAVKDFGWRFKKSFIEEYAS
jgi:adenylate cyclase